MKRLSFSVILIFGFLITIIPWEMHILSSKNCILPLSAGGSLSIKDGLTFAVTSGAGGDQLALSKDVKMLMKRISVNWTNLETSTDIFHFIIQEIKENPNPVVKLVIIKMMRCWYGTDEMWHENKILLIQSFYLVLSCMGIYLGIQHFNDKIPQIILMFSVVLYFWGMTTLVLSILRYMVPAMGIVIIFSAISVEKILIISRFYISTID